jgi:hypothetical protein
VDAAAAETLRANRTKFFDIVIPLVPFIPHRNARDLVLKLLAERHHRHRTAAGQHRCTALH